MAVLMWWVLPTAATIVGVCWAAWVRRAPRAPSDTATVDGFARFRAALAAPTPRRAVDPVRVTGRPSEPVVAVLPDAVRRSAVAPSVAPSVAPPVDLARPAASR